jgi:hypothetical protein
MQKTADYFNIDYRTVLRHLDTKLATKQNGQLLYFFSSKLPEEVLIELKNKFTRAKNATSEV